MRNRFIQGFSVLGLFFAMVLTGFMNPQAANAADANGNSIPDFYEASGWYNTAAEGTTSTSKPILKHTYGDFPIACNNDPSLAAYEIIWVTHPTTTPYTTNNLARVREIVRRATSIFAASSGQAIPNITAYKNAKIPRFVTQGTGNVCHPKITNITMSREQLSRETGNGEFATMVQNELGYTQANRKYIFFVEDSSVWTRAYARSSYDEYTPNANNSMNFRSVIYQPTKASLLSANDGESMINNEAWIMAHEMGHTIGGSFTDNPGNNPQNGNHSGDCAEVMCYGGGEPGETWNNGCGTAADWGITRAGYRLDCNDDDYFNMGSPAWETQRWNAAEHSQYLWGNPQSTWWTGTGTLSRSSIPTPKAIDIHEEHEHATRW